MRSLRAAFGHAFVAPVDASRGGTWGWVAVAVAAAVLILGPPVLGDRLVVAVIGIALIVVATRRPDLALLALIVFLPVHSLLLATLYGWGAPESVVRALAGWKEALALGVVAAGARAFLASGRRLDIVDWVALGFIALAAAYAFAPGFFAPDWPTSTDARFLGFRQTAGLAIVFLGARHALLPEGFAGKAARVAFGVAVFVAAVGIYEFFFSDAWNRFIVATLQYPVYQVQVLETFPPNPSDYRIYGTVAGEGIIRIGSVFLSHLGCAFFLVIGFAIGVERVARLGARGATLAGLAAIGTALLLTQTRSAIIGALIVAVLAFRHLGGRRQRLRVQVGLVMAIGLLAILPAAASTGFADRATDLSESNDPSAKGHVEQFWVGVRALEENPLGRGLGTTANTGQRFNTETAVVSENNYIGVGNELGIVGMVLFATFTVLAIRAIYRAATTSGGLAIAAAWTAATGLAVGALFLHVWSDYAVAWTLWGFAGAALGVAERRAFSSAVTASSAPAPAAIHDKAPPQPA